MTPELVRDLYARLNSGTLVKAAASQLGIASKVARRVANGNYDMDNASTLAWVETFGGMQARANSKKAGTGVIGGFEARS